METSAEKRSRFLGDFSTVSETPLDPSNESLLTQLHFSQFETAGISAIGFILITFIGISLITFLVPSLGVTIQDGISEQELPYLLSVSAIILGIESVVAILLQRTRTHEATDYLIEVYEELSSYQVALQDYLLELEKKFPPLMLSSVTTTKIMHYFMLVQLRENLGPLLAEVDTLLSYQSTAGNRAASELLKGSLQLSPSAGPTRTGMIEVPLYNLQRVRDYLTTHLQELLVGIEYQRSSLSLMDGPPPHFDHRPQSTR